LGPGESYRKLRFNQAKAQEPVFTQSAWANKEMSWTTDLVRKYLRDASRLADMPIHVTPHDMKRMGQQHLKDKGESS
jgi:hypothetical protein